MVAAAAATAAMSVTGVAAHSAAQSHTVARVAALRLPASSSARQMRSDVSAMGAARSASDAVRRCAEPRLLPARRGSIGARASVEQRHVAAPSAQAADTAAFSQGGFERLLLDLQAAICHESAERDGSGKAFIEDRWEREPGNPGAGYGITRVLEGGHVLEKAAANVSIVRGQLTAARAKAMSARQGRQLAEGTGYFAGALSLVFHSAHPLIPTFRSDIRYFQVDGQNGWFGGGADLTPSYLFPEDIREFHAFYRAICDAYHPALYAAAKAQCDSYFYLPARREHRGVGGIFFDDLDCIPPPHAPLALSPAAAASAAATTAAGAGEEGFERAHGFTGDVARGFMDSFWPIVATRRALPFTEAQQQWQLVRRGRYLEFNLLYDRGVKFGMDGNGRVESIMVSAPPLIAWRYNVQPQPGSPEEELVKVLKSPLDWA